MLPRHLLILQRFTDTLFDALIAANGVNATLSRQDPSTLSSAIPLLAGM
jgi:hypothetical protein